jgi:hypothetical protein
MLMNRIFGKMRESLAGIGTCSILAVAMVVAMPSVAQEKKVTQIAAVDNTKMGAYRALAQLCFQAYKRGDDATAAELARILERTWDAVEEQGGPNSLGIKKKRLFEQIDEAMDVFIKPVIHYAITAPDPVAVTAAYNDFLRKLRQGDELAK